MVNVFFWYWGNGNRVGIYAELLGTVWTLKKMQRLGEVITRTSIMTKVKSGGKND